MPPERLERRRRVVAGDDERPARTTPPSVTSSTPLRSVRTRMTGVRSKTSARRLTLRPPGRARRGTDRRSRRPPTGSRRPRVSPVSWRRRAGVSQEPSRPASRMRLPARGAAPRSSRRAEPDAQRRVGHQLAANAQTADGGAEVEPGAPERLPEVARHTQPVLRLQRPGTAPRARASAGRGTTADPPCPMRSAFDRAPRGRRRPRTRRPPSSRSGRRRASPPARQARRGDAGTRAGAPSGIDRASRKRRSGFAWVSCR